MKIEFYCPKLPYSRPLEFPLPVFAFSLPFRIFFFLFPVSDNIGITAFYLFLLSFLQQLTLALFQTNLMLTALLLLTETIVY